MSNKGVAKRYPPEALLIDVSHRVANPDSCDPVALRTNFVRSASEIRTHNLADVTADEIRRQSLAVGRAQGGRRFPASLVRTDFVRTPHSCEPLRSAYEFRPRKPAGGRDDEIRRHTQAVEVHHRCLTGKMGVFPLTGSQMARHLVLGASRSIGGNSDSFPSNTPCRLLE